MNILAVDDERNALEGLETVLRRALPEAEVYPFRTSADALVFAENTPCAVAFLDIELRDMNRESVLCTPSQLKEDIQELRRVVYGHTATDAHAVLTFHVTPQPLFHKNFDLLRQSFEDYLLRGYHLYILADSRKQQQRLKDIFDEMSGGDASPMSAGRGSGIVFTPVDKTLHEGFADDDMKVCFFTDHQIFDRFHKYNLKSDRARAGKMALTMKELQEMEIGDYVVHVDFGIGKFGGLVRVPIQNANVKTGEQQYQEVIRIT